MGELYEIIKKEGRIKTHRKPAMMVAMWVPADGQVILGSSVVSGPGDRRPTLFSTTQGGFAYNENPSNVPVGVRALLKTAETSGGWTDCHRTDGRCGEITSLATYFDSATRNKNWPLTPGIKMVAFGVPASGGTASVQAPCTGYGQDARGCKDFLSLVGIDWCGPGSTTDPLKKRTAISDMKFDCHVARKPATATNDPVLTMTTLLSISTFTDRATLSDSLTIRSDSTYIAALATGDLNTGHLTAFSKVPTSTKSSGLSTTAAVDASQVVGNQAEEASKCAQECVAGFRSCTSGQGKIKLKSKRSVDVMDCYALAKCYVVEVPYAIPSSTASGLKSNPEDPEASTGPSAKAKIDMDKADKVCDSVSLSPSALGAKFTATSEDAKTCEIQACEAIRSPGAKDSQGADYSLDGLWNCLKVAQGLV
ncbi:MAG: hypothetical protein Q9195_000572 [Heterodermia aff. obscurata]